MSNERNRNSSSVDPKILARMQREVSFIASQQRGQRRIKLDKGHNIIVRFLPARLGPDNMWYARIARHWLNKVPIVCPRLTGDDFGGNIETDCPVCALADELNSDRDKTTSDFGWRMAANPQYLTYCILWEKDGVKLPMEEVINPYEFILQKSSWEELKGFYVAGGRKSPDSVLDYEKGNDFSVIRTQKGTRLDKLEPQPIFDLDDPNFKSYIKKLEAAMKNPKVQIPTTAQLEAFADKVQEEAIKLHRHGREDDEPRRGRGRDDDDEPRSRRDDDDEPRRGRDDDEPRGRRGRDEEPYEPRGRSRDEERDEEPRRRGRDEEPQDEEPRGRRASREEEPQDEEPRRGRGRDAEEEEPRSRRGRDAEEEKPRVRSADEEPEEEPRRASRRGRDEEPEEEPRGRRAAKDDDDGDLGPQRRRGGDDDEKDPDERATSRRGRDEEPSEEAEGREKEPSDEPGEEDPDEKKEKLGQTENRRRATNGEAPRRDDEEDDNLPEDDKDNVPAAKKPLGKDGKEDEEPPPVERKGGKTADAIQSRLAKLKNRD